MYRSKYFIPTLKENPIGTEAVSHQLSLRAGLVNMLTAGVYTYLPLGYRTLKRIEDIIREEMNAAGACELLMPCLHPIEIWQKTGRDQTLKDVMIRFDDKRGRGMCLGPTHEEIITDLVRQFVQSYRSLPVTLYQIQTKFRDEIRTRFGIVRACEFVMKDAYSFDKDADGLKKNYDLMYKAYVNIFKRLGFDVKIVAADSGAMGGSVSHEFMVKAPIGEDAILECESCGHYDSFEEASNGKTCPKCSKGTMKKHVAIELGHIFQLGTKYSDALQAHVLHEDGKKYPILMGCYGIGVSRVIAAVIETHHDDKGIQWPKEVAPFDIEIIPLAKSKDECAIWDLAEKYYRELTQAGFDVLMDDREESAGRKFNDADLIGIPQRIVIGQKNLSDGNVEIKNRATGEVHIIGKDDVLKFFKP